MSTDNVTPLRPGGPKKKPSRTALEIYEAVVRAKQIVMAVRVSQDHEGPGFEYHAALEQVEDMLDDASGALYEHADRERDAESPGEGEPP
jgi:hypothetical protein